VTNHAIFDVIEQLRTARKAESECGLALADVKAALERCKAIAISEAYQAGKVDGKNEGTRKAQEADVLLGATVVHEAEVLVRQLESKHVAARIEMQYQAERYAATLALIRTEPVSIAAGRRETWPGDAYGV